jgi:hypothetical protein
MMSGEHDLNGIVDERIRRILREVMAEPQERGSVALSDPVDEKTREQISQYLLVSSKPYLKRKEAAIYLDCSERSIAEWSARAVGDNPFPVSNAGGEPRYKRERIDEWAECEAQRQRLRLAG